MKHPTKELQVEQVGTVYTYRENGVQFGGTHFEYKGRTYSVEWEVKQGLNAFFAQGAGAAFQHLSGYSRP